MLDERLNPWLLEMNLTPGLNRRTSNLNSLISRMLKGLFKIVFANDKGEIIEEARDETPTTGCGNWTMLDLNPGYDSREKYHSMLEVRGTRVAPKTFHRLERALAYSSSQSILTRFLLASVKPWITRRFFSSSIIQATARRYLVKLKMWRQERCLAAHRIQIYIRKIMRKVNTRREKAACIIQKSSRRYLHARITSAMSIQLASRKWLSKLRDINSQKVAKRWRQLCAKEIRKLRDIKNKNALLLINRYRLCALGLSWQRWTRLIAKSNAVSAVQKIWRRFANSKKLKQERAAVLIVKCARQYTKRMRRIRSRWKVLIAGYSLLTKRRRAAFHAWQRRGALLSDARRRASCQIQRAFRKHLSKRSAAATRIGTVCRGLIARRRVAAFREQTLAMAALEIFAAMHSKRGNRNRKVQCRNI